MRLEALNAFTLLLKGAGKAATEPTLKELHKFLKTALPDKAQVIRVAAAQVSQILHDQFAQTLTHLLTRFLFNSLSSVYKHAHNMHHKTLH